ncbi:MAG: RluA family pseudouridine synthase [Desulfofustis sp.]|nr:RluA family pseudouridine synthase [Desulfofustis sp.]
MPADLHLIHSDRSLVVVNKPGGLLAVPGRGPDKQDCIVNRARQRFPDMVPQPAVHRLAMQTSGLMLLARTAGAHRELSRQFAQRLVRKRYIALLEGTLPTDAGTIALRFRLDPENRPHQVYDPDNGKKGVTLWRKLAEEATGTRVEFTPLTGRTHQLRLHAAHRLGLNAPIIGDSLYGNGSFGERMFLHSSYLAFIHPETGIPREFFSEPPF